MSKTEMPQGGVLMGRCERLAARWEAQRDADPLFMAAQAVHSITDPLQKVKALADLEAALPSSVRQIKRDGWARMGSVAIVPLVGSLQKDGDYWSRYTSWYSSTREFAAALMDARDGKGIRSAVIYADSPGGTVDGTYEAGEIIRSLVDSGFPVVTFASNMLASAAYWLGSQASLIYADPTSEGLGSLCVIYTHQDRSKMMADYGVEITHFTSGKFKAAGSPYVPLTDEARAYIQASVDTAALDFRAAVESSRVNRKRPGGRVMTPDALDKVFAEAAVYHPKEALALGLVDGLGSLAQVVADLNSAAK